MRPMTGDWKEALGMVISIVVFFGFMVLVQYFVNKDEKKKLKEGKIFYGGYGQMGG